MAPNTPELGAGDPKSGPVPVGAPAGLAATGLAAGIGLSVCWAARPLNRASGCGAAPLPRKAKPCLGAASGNESRGGEGRATERRLVGGVAGGHLGLAPLRSVTRTAPFTRAAAQASARCRHRCLPSDLGPGILRSGGVAAPSGSATVQRLRRGEGKSVTLSKIGHSDKTPCSM